MMTNTMVLLFSFKNYFIKSTAKLECILNFFSLLKDFVCVYLVWSTQALTGGRRTPAQSCSLPLGLAHDLALRLTCSGLRPPRTCPCGPDTL